MFNTNYSMPTNLESIVSKQSDVEKALFHSERGYRRQKIHAGGRHS